MEKISKNIEQKSKKKNSKKSKNIEKFFEESKIRKWKKQISKK